ncbi:MAG TPA: transcription antitermination factor NusB [Gammaproteobacteria bacterium]|nr:transcription antitermination factor NusB [Gammaproteobacteria bacterium]
MSKQRGFRSRARRLALQALYQWQISADDPRDILAQFLADKRDRREADYFRTLFMNASGAAAELDALAAQHLDRPLAQLDPVEHAILWISLLEFREQLDVPYRAVINEAVELAKDYGAEGSHKYVNAVLDRAAPVLRPLEARR